MKKIFIIQVIGLILLISCKKEKLSENSGQVMFNISSADILKSASSDDGSISSVLVSIRKAGEIITEFKKISIYKFKEDFISEPISLKTDKYELLDFMVLDNNDSIVYLTPRKGAEYDYLVSEALPIEFSVNTDETTNLNLEVIATSDYQPEDFGYSTFSLNIVETNDVLLSVFIYDTVSHKFILSSANLTVESLDVVVLRKDLISEINDVVLRAYLSDYSFIVSKTGYTSQTIFLPETAIEKYKNEPLIVILYPETLKNELIGLVNNQLVKINKNTAELELIVDIDNPGNLKFLGLTIFNNKFYTIEDPTGIPKLYSISFDGKLTKMGNLTYNREQIKLCESIASDLENGRLFVSASLDGGINDFDYYSESLMSVDIENGECELVYTTNTDVIDPEIDAMEIVNGQLYFYDGAAPGQDYLKIFKEDISLLGTMVPIAIFEQHYRPVPDLAVENDKIYFIDKNELFQIDLTEGAMNFIGITHEDISEVYKTFRGVTIF